jgi:hypothetical protein
MRRKQPKASAKIRAALLERKSPARETALEHAFLKLAETAFSEWNSPECEAVFREL